MDEGVCVVCGRDEGEMVDWGWLEIIESRRNLL
jgi:predicted Fe-S protein YdhL (DUF1289 family)